MTVSIITPTRATLLTHLAARTTIRAHRQTERRVHEISTGKKRPHDVEVVSL
jgi:hypothetical protein